MKEMFAGCISLDELNLAYSNLSNLVDSSYMIFDAKIDEIRFI